MDNYYHYFEQFGLKQRTGIDLPGEAGTIMHKKEDMGNVELATVAFGQSFQITAIQLLTTASSIINGGNRITPHFGIEALTRDGEVEETFSYPVQTGIVSEETSATMRYILEMVVAEGSGRNGQVQGFRVGGKTATSQTLPRGRSYFDAMIYLNDANLQPLQLVLRSILVQNTPQPGMIADIQSTAEMAKVAEQLKYATIVVSSLPLLVMYPFFQKYFDEGIMVGSVKG